MFLQNAAIQDPSPFFSIGVLKTAVRVLNGWINYHGISGNERKVKAFLHLSRQIIRKWINRRGRKHPMNWETFNRVLKFINFPEQWKTISMFE